MRSVIRATTVLILGTIASKCLGFARELLFAHKFGASEISDAFLLTRSIPEIIFSALAIAISTNFIPCYMAISDKEKRENFFSNLLNIFGLLTILGTILVNIFSRQILWVLSPALPQSTLNYALIMLHIVSFLIIPLIIGQLFQGYLQIKGFFLSTSLLGIITNVIMISAQVIATPETFPILSGGIVLAQIISFFMFFVSARKTGFRYNACLELKDPDVRMMILLTLPLIIGKLAEHASFLVDQNLAAYLGVGVLSSMSYAALLSSSISAVVTNSLVTAVFPMFSRLASEGTKTCFMSSFRQYIRILFYTLSPISVFIFMFADDIVVCVLERGNLHTSAVIIIRECMACYAVGIIPMGIHDYIVRSFYAFRNTKTPTYIDILTFLGNVGMSIFGVRYYGHIGVALATSFSFWGAAFLLGYFFVKNFKVPVFHSLVSELMLCFLGAVFPGIMAFYIFHIVCVLDSFFARLVLELVLFSVFYIMFLFCTQRELFLQFWVLMRRKN